MQEKKSECLTLLKEFAKTNENNHLDSKVALVENKINNLSMSELNDETITRFLTITKLVEEMNLGE